MKKKLISLITLAAVSAGMTSFGVVHGAEISAGFSYSNANFDSVETSGMSTFRIDTQKNLVMTLQDNPESGEELQIAPEGIKGESLNFKMTFYSEKNLSGGGFYDSHPILNMGGAFSILKIGGNYIRIKTPDGKNSQIAVNAGKYYTIFGRINTTDSKIVYSVYETAAKENAEAIKDVTYRENALVFCSTAGIQRSELGAVTLGTKPNTSLNEAESDIAISEMTLKEENELYSYVDLSAFISDSSIAADGLGRIGDIVGDNWLGGAASSNSYGGIDAAKLNESGLMTMSEYSGGTKTGAQTPFQLYTDGYAGGSADSFGISTSQTIDIGGKNVKYINVLAGVSGWDDINAVINYREGSSETVTIPVERQYVTFYNGTHGDGRYNDFIYGFAPVSGAKWLVKGEDGKIAEFDGVMNGTCGLMSVKIPVNASREIDSVSLRSDKALVYGVTLENLTKAEEAALENNYFEYKTGDFSKLDLSGHNTFKTDSDGNLVMSMQKALNTGERLNLDGEGVKGNVRFKMIYSPEIALTAPYYQDNAFLKIGSFLDMWVLGDKTTARISGETASDATPMFAPGKYYTFIADIDTADGNVTYGTFACDSIQEAQEVVMPSDTANRIKYDTLKGKYFGAGLGNVILCTNPSEAGTEDSDITVYYVGLYKNEPKIENIIMNGTAAVGNTLSVSADIKECRVNYKWQSAAEKDGEYKDITGADASSYVLTPAEGNKYVRAALIPVGYEDRTVYSEAVLVEYKYLFADLSAFINGSSGTDAVAKPGDNMTGEWLGGFAASANFGGLNAEKLADNGIITAKQYKDGTETGESIPFELYKDGYTAGKNDSFTVFDNTEVSLKGGYDRSVSVLFSASGWNVLHANINYADGTCDKNEITVERERSVWYNMTQESYKNNMFGFVQLSGSKWLEKSGETIAERADTNQTAAPLAVTLVVDATKEISSITLKASDTVNENPTTLLVYAVTEEPGRDMPQEVSFEPVISAEGTSASVLVTMSNTTQKPQTYCIVLAAYGENNKLLKAAVSDEYTLNPGSVNLEKSFVLQGIPDGAVKYKAMLWENKDNIRPLGYAEK